MIKLYQPTKTGVREMFSDYEKDMAHDNMIDIEIDDIKEARHLKEEHDCHSSLEDGCNVCEQIREGI